MEETLKSILGKFILDVDLVNKMVSPKLLPYWERAFTHESINFKDNYENLEFLGDGTVNYAFVLYLRRELKIEKSEYITNMLGYYMGTTYQPSITRKLELDRLIRKREEIKLSDNILEDVFESFFGVIELICTKLHKMSPTRVKTPVEYTVDFFRWYFSNHGKIDMAKGGIINKNFFLNMYHLFSRESTQAKFKCRYIPGTQSYFYNPQFLDSIKMYSEDLFREIKPIITKKGKSSEDYYITEVVKAFKSRGYDEEWLEYEKQKITFDKSYNELAKQHGLSRFILDRNEHNSYNLVAQSNDPVTKKSISKILHVFKSDNFNELKEEAQNIILRKYVGDG